MIVTICPTCQEELDASAEPELGLQIVCPHCGTEYEVTWLFPLTLGYVENSPLIYSTTVFDEGQN